MMGEKLNGSPGEVFQAVWEEMMEGYMGSAKGSTWGDSRRD